MISEVWFSDWFTSIEAEKLEVSMKMRTGIDGIMKVQAIVIDDAGIERVVVVGVQSWYDSELTVVARTIRPYFHSLMEGDLAVGALTSFRDHDLHLIPAREELTIVCECLEPDCQHGAGVLHLLIDEILAEPMILLLLRGVDVVRLGELCDSVVTEPLVYALHTETPEDFEARIASRRGDDLVARFFDGPAPPPPDPVVRDERPVQFFYDLGAESDRCDEVLTQVRREMASTAQDWLDRA